MAHENVSETQAEVGQTWWPAVGVHVGLATVCYSAVYTIQPEGWFSSRQWASFALIGVAALVVAAVGRGRAASSQVGRLLLALGAATALYLAYDPLLDTLPGLSALTVGFLGQFEPGLAFVGVLVALVFWLAHRISNPGPCVCPLYCKAIVVSAAAVLVLGLVMHLALSGIYDLSGTTSNLVVGFRVLQMASIMLVAIEMAGAVGVGALAHIYVGLALLAAVARNLMT